MLKKKILEGPKILLFFKAKNLRNLKILLNFFENKIPEAPGFFKFISGTKHQGLLKFFYNL